MEGVDPKTFYSKDYGKLWEGDEETTNLMGEVKPRTLATTKLAFQNEDVNEARDVRTLERGDNELILSAVSDWLPGVKVSILGNEAFNRKLAEVREARERIEKEFNEKIAEAESEINELVKKFDAVRREYLSARFQQTGDMEWQIPQAISNAIPELSGKIVCDDDALEHIKTQHPEIRRLGYADELEFVSKTIENVSAVYRTGRGDKSYELIAELRSPDGSLNRVIIYLKKSEKGDFYDVATAHPVRNGAYKKKTPLWSHTPNAKSAAASLNLSGTVPSLSKADVGNGENPESDVNKEILDETKRQLLEAYLIGKQLALPRDENDWGDGYLYDENHKPAWSNRANYALKMGLLPAAMLPGFKKLGVSISSFNACMPEEEWHHVGENYKRVNFYKPDILIGMPTNHREIKSVADARKFYALLQMRDLDLFHQDLEYKGAWNKGEWVRPETEEDRVYRFNTSVEHESKLPTPKWKTPVELYDFFDAIKNSDNANPDIKKLRRLAQKADSAVKKKIKERKEYDKKFLKEHKDFYIRDGTRREPYVGYKGLLFQRAYTGSGARWAAVPGNPLGGFDANFIGTGEGAQAYGWGFYATSVWGIAKTYAEDNAGSGMSKLAFDYSIPNSAGNQIYDIEEFYEKEVYDKLVNGLSDGTTVAPDRAKKILLYFHNWFSVEVDGYFFTGKFDPVRVDRLYDGIERHLAKYQELLVAGHDKFRTAVIDYENRLAAVTFVSEILSSDKFQSKLNKLRSEFNVDLETTRHIYTLDFDDNAELLEWNTPLTEEQWARFIAVVKKNILRFTSEKDKNEILYASKPMSPKQLHNYAKNEIAKTQENGPRLISELLREAGFIGHTFPAASHGRGDYSQGTNYVFYGERDARVVDAYRWLRDENGGTMGWFNPATGEIVVRENSRIDTVLHELGWHATYAWARDNAPELFAKMREYAAKAPQEVRDAVAKLVGKVVPWRLSQQRPKIPPPTHFYHQPATTKRVCGRAWVGGGSRVCCGLGWW